MKATLLLLLLALTLYSAPTYSRLKEFQNANGTTFFATPKGNHHLNWIQTQDGDILKYNTKTNNFEFAKIEGKRLVPSGTIYMKVLGKQVTQKISTEDIQDLRNLSRQNF